MGFTAAFYRSFAMLAANASHCLRRAWLGSSRSLSSTSFVSGEVSVAPLRRLSANQSAIALRSSAV